MSSCVELASSAVLCFELVICEPRAQAREERNSLAYLFDCTIPHLASASLFLLLPQNDHQFFSLLLCCPDPHAAHKENMCIGCLQATRGSEVSTLKPRHPSNIPNHSCCAAPAGLDAWVSTRPFLVELGTSQLLTWFLHAAGPLLPAAAQLLHSTAAAAGWSWPVLTPMPQRRP